MLPLQHHTHMDRALMRLKNFGKKNIFLVWLQTVDNKGVLKMQGRTMRDLDDE